jgi:diaminohydroxyphosphoribosylaminopyrimidine deaminase/5-amino-6-(5-phosphoribosylamino)uracil reductase
MDAIVVGAGTARFDDPLLTARPCGPRVATRIVLDPRTTLPAASRLVQTIDEAPLLVAVSNAAPPEQVASLRTAGAEILPLPGENGSDSSRLSLRALFEELGRRRMTNILIEGGSAVLGSCFDDRQIDECHVFIAPRLFGGSAALSPLGGVGIDNPADALPLDNPSIERLEGDIYVHGRCSFRSSPSSSLE